MLTWLPEPASTLTLKLNSVCGVLVAASTLPGAKPVTVTLLPSALVEVEKTQALPSEAVMAELKMATSATLLVRSTTRNMASVRGARAWT